VKVLFLCPSLPCPPVNGGHHRSLGLIRCLSRFASVHVFAMGPPRDERADQTRDALSAWGTALEVYQPTGPGREEADEENTHRLPDAASHFRSPEMGAALAERFPSMGIDVAHVEEVVMAQYVDLLACPRVIDRQKVDWAYHEAMAGLAPKAALLHLREAARFRYWERRLVGVFDRMLVPGIGDQRLLEPLHGPGSVSVVPIAIPDELRAPVGPRRVEHVLLYGALDYAPNVEAQAWFFREVWPGLKSAAPDLKAVLVGSGRAPLSSAPIDDARVEFRGFVPDIQEVLQGPGVLVVPVQVGGGARTKILEALACGMPLVSTAVGVENLDLVPGRDFLLAETAEDVTAAVLRLLRDPDLVASFGREGPARATSFRWSRIEALVEPIYREALSGRGRSVAPLSVGSAASMGSAFEAEASRLEAALVELEHSPANRATSAITRRVRRWRRSAPVWRAEERVIRSLDRWLTAPIRPGFRHRFRGALVGLLARVTGRR
jgi:polysaccharide biosynthesis protein PslH